FERGLEAIQPQFALLLFGSVALGARLLEDGFNVFRVSYPCSRGWGRKLAGIHLGSLLFFLRRLDGGQRQTESDTEANDEQSVHIVLFSLDSNIVEIDARCQNEIQVG